MRAAAGALGGGSGTSRSSGGSDRLSSSTGTPHSGGGGGQQRVACTAPALAARARRCGGGAVSTARRRARTSAALVLPDAVTALAAQPGWDYACAAFAAVGAFVWVQLFKSLAAAGLMDQKLSRKLVHTTAGPLFVLTWPLFRWPPERAGRVLCAGAGCSRHAGHWAAAARGARSAGKKCAVRPGGLQTRAADAASRLSPGPRIPRPLLSALPEARFIAAAVPAINAARLLLVGAGLVDDPGLVKSTSRSGERGELLRGPLYYVLVLIGATTVFWRDSPAGLIAVAMMCGGDGLADIVGRRWGAGAPLPWNTSKSWAGSGGMLLGGGGMAVGWVGPRGNPDSGGGRIASPLGAQDCAGLPNSRARVARCPPAARQALRACARAPPRPGACSCAPPPPAGPGSLSCSPRWASSPRMRPPRCCPSSRPCVWCAR